MPNLYRVISDFNGDPLATIGVKIENKEFARITIMVRNRSFPFSAEDTAKKLDDRLVKGGDYIGGPYEDLKRLSLYEICHHTGRKISNEMANELAKEDGNVDDLLKIAFIDHRGAHLSSMIKGDIPEALRKQVVPKEMTKDKDQSFDAQQYFDEKSAPGHQPFRNRGNVEL